MKRHLLIALAILCLLVTGLFGTGCARYEVTDPGTGKVYYTHNWDHKQFEQSGAIAFKDAATGKTVTLPRHEVRKVKDREWKEAVAAQKADQGE